MKRLVFTLLLALVLWTVMFSPWTAPHVPFWWTMAGSALTLCILSTCFNPGWWRQVRWSPSNILLGVLIAVGLWLVFWTGDKVSAWLFDFARPQVDAIYGMKSGWSPWVLSVLMLLLIGPAEEIFWRGYVQRTLSLRWGANAGFAGQVALGEGAENPTISIESDYSYGSYNVTIGDGTQTVNPSPNLVVSGTIENRADEGRKIRILAARGDLWRHKMRRIQKNYKNRRKVIAF